MEETKIYEEQGDDGLDTCRLCLKRCSLDARHWGLFETDLPQKLMAFAAVQIQENDGLPRIVCTNCRNLVYMTYNFKCQVEKSDHDLRQALLMKESTHWPTVSIVKSIENISKVEDMVPCLQKNIIDSPMTIQDDRPNNTEQFIFDITSSVNIENKTSLKDNQMQSNNSVDSESVIENSNVVIPFEIDNVISESESNRENSLMTFETQYETVRMKDDLNIKENFPKLEIENNQDNSNQSEDEKPLILRTKRPKCNYCIKSFANLSLLEKHAVIHKKQLETSYNCYLCDEQFSSIDNVKNHAMTIHGIYLGREKIIENSKIQRLINDAKKTDDVGNRNEDLIEENTEGKRNNKYTCKFCSRQFTYHRPFMAHIKSHPEYDDKLLSELNKDPMISEAIDTSDASLTLNLEVTSSDSMETTSHSRNIEDNHHSVNFVHSHTVNSEINPLLDNLESSSNSVSLNTGYPVNTETLKSVNLENSSQDNMCNIGDISYRDSMDESEKEIHPGDDDEDDQDSQDDNMPTASMQCNHCGKLVATLRNLKRHLLTHSGLKHNCSICGKDFSRPDKLREHQQLKHMEELFSKSDSDNESSDDNNTAVNRKKEKNNRPYKCTLCPKAFAQAQSLSNHEERHKRAQDVQKRYLCEVCSKCFAQSGSLVAHMRTHTGVKPYVCNVCSRAFTKSTYLQLHLRTHSGEKPYICQYCSRAFARANTLARHITMHTGEAKYQCQICTKSFRRLTSLNEHTYTHTGQRPYACKICSKRYNNAGSLYAHTKKCKTMQATNNSTCYPVSLQLSDNAVIPQNESNTVPQLLIFADKKIEEAITSDIINAEASACQFMIANVQTQKPLTNNMLETFTIQEPDIYNVNTKQFKTSYYGLYPSM